MERKLIVTSSPHIKTPESVQSVMIDVLVALFPAALAGVIFFGWPALLTMVLCTVSAMVAEALVLREKNIFGDGSAAVTGLLLAMVLPPAVPWWISVLGGAIAIIIGKQVFGGIGNNIFNPALVARAILLASWAGHLTYWVRPVDLTTAATPLELGADAFSFTNLFVGAIPGSLGETSAFALILGAAWLFYKGHIDWRIPGGYIGTVFVMGLLFEGFGSPMAMVSAGLFHVLAGGVLLGALFMATDMVTSPVTARGRLIFGIGCGVMTMLVRLYGAFPEGVTFAILLMNALTPLIDNLTLPTKYGEVAK
ncbi:RnfABCDGE type electron transport complex subunit D [Dethiobacter alkaliphilus]|uniref:Ion-translocating oxidoreductase complex subunit D n=1 Tax=Dethiobacter alkaliphilus AHT 1 TaxID=555088 RepID=C0GEY4_DETAL|nr:RnfABCDGE type electron transport complex subunit D [Dethiobacter alkaliphilus]EEG78166.1 electron transport complex, RnfABCDGE type, D subunit [Dethiobacter alkaliphilus AHT 1]